MPRARVSVRPGMTLVELLVIVALYLVTAAILFPVVFPRPGGCGPSPRTVCHRFQGRIGTAFRMYAADNDGRLPPAGYPAAPFQHVSWHNLLDPYLQGSDVWRCPHRYPGQSKRPRSAVDYGYNALYLTTLARDFSNWDNNSGTSLDTVENAAQVVLIADTHASRYRGACRDERKFLLPPSAFPADCWGRPDARHAGTVNVLWLDGHCASPAPARFYTGQNPTDRFFDLKADPESGGRGAGLHRTPRRNAGSPRAGEAQQH